MTADKLNLLQMNPTTYTHLLIWAMLLASCSTTPEPEARPDFKEWQWATCLPSAAGEEDCAGEKPSWLHYQATGEIVWRYLVSGTRTIYTDEFGTTWLIYDQADCLDYYGKKTGQTKRMGFPGYLHGFDPVTGLMPKTDQHGPLPGEVFFIEGLIGPNGQVAPLIWN